jgi:hypothetical protein
MDSIRSKSGLSGIALDTPPIILWSATGRLPLLPETPRKAVSTSSSHPS